jgi:hypothetical protein
MDASCPPYYIGGGGGSMLEKMISTTVEEDGTSTIKWLQCSRCKDPKKRSDRMKYLVKSDPDYACKLLGLDFLISQMLSLIDISANFVRKFSGMSGSELPNRRGVWKGALNKSSLLLGSPLVVYGEAVEENKIPTEVKELAATLLLSCKVFKQYSCLLEQELPGHGLPILPRESIDHISKQAREIIPLYMDGEEDKNGQLGSMSRYVVAAATLDNDEALEGIHRDMEASGEDVLFSVGKVVPKGGFHTVLSTTSSGLTWRQRTKRSRKRGQQESTSESESAKSNEDEGGSSKRSEAVVLQCNDLNLGFRCMYHLIIRGFNES